MSKFLALTSDWPGDAKFCLREAKHYFKNQGFNLNGVVLESDHGPKFHLSRVG